MKKIFTTFLLKFALVATVLAIVFRLALTYGVKNELNLFIILLSVLYSICMFAAGWYYGKKDANYLPIYDVGFRFHFTTYLVFVSIGELALCFGLNAAGIHITAIIWGIFLVIHFLFFLWARKKSIQGLSKEELFE